MGMKAIIGWVYVLVAWHGKRVSGGLLEDDG
jgi:hypothetical protein